MALGRQVDHAADFLETDLCAKLHAPRYLQTREALSSAVKARNGQILYLVHDCHPKQITTAQAVLLQWEIAG